MASTARSPKPSPRDWLDRYLAVQRKYDNRMTKMLAEAAEDAEKAIQALGGKSGIGASVSRAQITGSRGAIAKVMSSFWRKTGDLIRAGKLEASSEALGMSFDWDEVLLRRVYPSASDRAAMRRYFIARNYKNIDAALRRVNGERVELSTQVYRSKALADGWVDRAVNSGLARGATVDQIAKDVRGMINPNTPGGVTYAARRLARTEINAAYHAQSIESQENKPWTNGMRWRLSGSHRHIDECDLYARKDQGLGKGVFPIGSVPKKPHPQCFCYVTAELMTIEEFNSQFLAGGFEDYVQSNYRPS